MDWDDLDEEAVVAVEETPDVKAGLDAVADEETLIGETCCHLSRAKKIVEGMLCPSDASKSCLNRSQ